jgi:hypothetical protein
MYKTWQIQRYFSNNISTLQGLQLKVFKTNFAHIVAGTNLFYDFFLKTYVFEVGTISKKQLSSLYNQAMNKTHTKLVQARLV